MSENPKRPAPLYDIPTAAAVLNISVHTLRRWVGQRRVPVTRLGRAIRFSPASIERFISKNTSPEREGPEAWR